MLMTWPIMPVCRLKKNMNCWDYSGKSKDRNILKRHLGKVLPVVAEMEVLKERIMLNGHFKNLSSFRFE